MSSKLRIPIPAVPFAPPVYACRYNPLPFTLNGDLDKNFWKDIPFTEPFRDIEGEIRPKPRFETRAKMAWDDENLYIGAVLEGDEIWATVTEHDDVIFRDNDFEIFIDTDSDTQIYLEYEMNAGNTNWDLLLTKAYRDMGKPVNSLEIRGLRSAVKIDGTLNTPDPRNRRWSLEVVIPFYTLAECNVTSRKPVPGDFYRVNFSRVQWKVDVKDGVYQKRLGEGTGEPLPEDNWVWAPTGVVNIHYPELWGFLFFAGRSQSAEEFAIPENELRKWELRKLYYAQHALGDTCGAYTEDLAVLTGILAENSPCAANRSVDGLPYTLSVTPHSFEITCPAEDGKGTIAIFSDGRTEIFSQ